MSDEKQDNPNPSLEQMLRTWGANESIAKAAPPAFEEKSVSAEGQRLKQSPPPVPPHVLAAIAEKKQPAVVETPATPAAAPPANKAPAVEKKKLAPVSDRKSLFTIRLRPVYVAAATLVLAVGGILLIWSLPSTSQKYASEAKVASPVEAEPSKNITPPSQNVELLKAELAKLNAQYDDLANQKAAETARADRLQAELASAGKTPTAVAVATKPAADKERIDFLEADRVRLAGSVAIANRRAEEAQRDALVAKQRITALENKIAVSDAEAVRLAARYDELAKELASATKKMQEAEAANSEVEKTMAAIKIERARIYGDMQRLYFAASAGDATGLAAVQKVCKANRLVARAAEMGKYIKDPAGIALRDRLETLLTRIEVMNPNDPAALDAFVKSVNEAKVIGQIDDLLAKGNDAPEARNWLLESKLILIGAGCVA